MAFAIQKVGLLGVTTNTTVGTHDAYTVPASSSARVKLMWGINNASSQCQISIIVNNLQVWLDLLASGEDCFTGVVEATGVWDPTAVKVHSNLPSGTVAIGAGVTQTAFMTPLPITYALDANDTVQMRIASNAPSGAYLGVQGVEFAI